jgi:hypothetical protein
MVSDSDEEVPITTDPNSNPLLASCTEPEPAFDPPSAWHPVRMSRDAASMRPVTTAKKDEPFVGSFREL